MTPLEDDFLYPYNHNNLTTLHGLVLRMIEFGVSAADVDVMIQQRVENLITEYKLAAASDKGRSLIQPPPQQKKIGVCPSCGEQLSSMNVNRTKCTMVGGDYTAMLICNNTDCSYTKLIRE